MEHQQSTTPRRKTGRPLSFDPEAALEQAMLLFWRHGFEATALSDLTQAMGVTAPSIYAAFGDKKGLFRAAVRRYVSKSPVAAEEFIAEAPTARDAARGLLEGAAVTFTGADTPPGCLLATATISCSAAAADLQEELAAIRRSIEAALCRRIADASVAGEIPSETDAEALAGHVMAVIQGLSTLARDGAPRAKLMRIAAAALTAFPREPRPVPRPLRSAAPRPRRARAGDRRP